MDGLRNIASSGRTLHSINSSTAGNEYWNGKSVSVGSSVTALVAAGEDSFISLFNQIGEAGNGVRGGNKKISAFLTTRGIQTKLAAQYQSMKRFNDAKAVDVEGGYTGINVNMVPVIFDDDCPKTWAFAVDNKALKWYEQDGPGWLQVNDSSVFRLKAGATAGTNVAAWQATWDWYAALGCHRPNAVGALKWCLDDTASSGA